MHNEFNIKLKLGKQKYQAVLTPGSDSEGTW